MPEFVSNLEDMIQTVMRTHHYPRWIARLFLELAALNALAARKRWEGTPYAHLFENPL